LYVFRAPLHLATEKIASIRWRSQGKKGQDRSSTDRCAQDTSSVIGDDRTGTNGTGAAQRACFTMAFSFSGV
jgi:hypothetical protein